MKKTLSLALSLIMIITTLTMLPFTALADETGKCGESLTYTFESATGNLTISGTGAMYDYDDDSPEYYSKKAYITSVTIESGVTHIGNYAFSNINGLTSINIPESVTEIGDKAFYGCTDLTSVDVYFETPLEITENTFSNRANATLYVPFCCKEAFEAAPYWQDFMEITEPTKKNIVIDGILYRHA